MIERKQRSREVFMRNLYAKLKELYWPIVTVRIMIVLAVGMSALVVGIYVAFSVVFLAVFFVAGLYIIVLSIGLIVCIFKGSVASNKSNATQKKRSIIVFTSAILVALEAIWGDEYQVFHINTQDIIGFFGVSLLLMSLMYLSMLALDGMKLDESLPNEDASDRYARWAIYMPGLFFRDLVIPGILVVVATISVYERTGCLTAHVADDLRPRLGQALDVVVPKGTPLGVWVDQRGEAFVRAIDGLLGAEFFRHEYVQSVLASLELTCAPRGVRT